jgi:hypothetical protein
MRRTFRRQSFRAACLIAAGAWLAAGAITRTAAQQKPAAESTGLEVIQLRPQFYVIAGAGSNVAVQPRAAGRPSSPKKTCSRG